LAISVLESVVKIGFLEISDRMSKYWEVC
jgi:hypothetical protein